MPNIIKMDCGFNLFDEMGYVLGSKLGKKDPIIFIYRHHSTHYDIDRKFTTPWRWYEHFFVSATSSPIHPFWIFKNFKTLPLALYLVFTTIKYKNTGSFQET